MSRLSKLSYFQQEARNSLDKEAFLVRPLGDTYSANVITSQAAVLAPVSALSPRPLHP
jgi:hypothetical protein